MRFSQVLNFFKRSASLLIFVSDFFVSDLRIFALKSTDQSLRWREKGNPSPLEVRKSRGVVEEKERRVVLRTREAMNFDPSTHVLSRQKEVDKYLATYGVRLPSKIKVE